MREKEERKERRLSSSSSSHSSFFLANGGQRQASFFSIAGCLLFPFLSLQNKKPKLTDDSGDNVVLPCAPHCRLLFLLRKRRNAFVLSEKKKRGAKKKRRAYRHCCCDSSFSSLSSPLNRPSLHLCLKSLQLSEHACSGARGGGRAVLVPGRLGPLWRRGGRGRHRWRRRRFFSFFLSLAQMLTRKCFSAEEYRLSLARELSLWKKMTTTTSAKEKKRRRRERWSRGREFDFFR